MDWTKITEWIKLSPKYLIPIGIVSGLLIYLPEPKLEYFGLSNFVQLTRPYLSLFFLCSTALTISHILIYIFNWGITKIKNIRKFKNIKERLFLLTKDEKNILLGYFIKNTRSQYLSVSDGIVNELEGIDIIYRSSQIGSIDAWSFNIQPWAWIYIKKNWKKIFSKDDIQNYQGYYFNNNR